MSNRKLYFHRLRKQSDNATTFYLTFPTVHSGEVLYITAGSAEEEDSTKNIAFGKFIGDEFLPWQEYASQALGIRCNLTETHHLTSGERPAMRFESTTLNDYCAGHYEGYVVEVE